MALELSKNALQLLEKRYLLRDAKGKIIETPEGMFHRVARFIASAENERNRYENAFYEMMASLEFLPNSPTLMNADTEISQLAACFILPVPDELKGIFESVKNAAIIHQTAGGTGFCFSHLRPRGDIVDTVQGVASGPVSFMTAFDKATQIIKQGGRRRGANMAVLHVWHPDIEEFITAKQTSGVLENFNVSVAVDDKFMRAVENNGSYPLINPRNGKPVKKINAQKLFRLICQSAWKSAEPGLLFMDTIKDTNPTPGYPIHSTNPCGEAPMPDYESCTLGSINLAKFAALDWSKKPWQEKLDWKRLQEVVYLAIRFLDDVVDVNRYPLPQIRQMTLAHRRLGLGVMGFADMLAMIGVRYDSKEAYAIAEELMKFITEEARKTSYELAGTRGPFPGFNQSTWAKKYDRMRNATVTSIAPTGSISMIADTSSGVEPLFALSYVKTVRAGKYAYTDRIFARVLKERGLYDKKLMKKIMETGSIQHTKLPKDIRAGFRVAYDIPPEAHVHMQAAFQRHTDLAVSKTINLPATATPRDVEKVYLLAWKLGCKGITIYRSASRKEQVLHVGKKPTTAGIEED